MSRPPTHISTSIEIDALPSKVWECLTDFPRFPEWNPLLPEISGPLEPGARLKVRIAPSGGRGIVLRPRIVDFKPGICFAWKGSLGIPGIFDGTHRFDVRPLGTTATRFIHEESFTGFLVPLVWSGMEARTRAGFKAMNEALRDRAQRT